MPDPKSTTPPDAPQSPPEPSDDQALAELQSLLESNPELGDQILTRLMPSADPGWMRGEINGIGEISRGDNAGGISLDDFLEKSRGPESTIDIAELQAFWNEFSNVFDGPPPSLDEVASTKFQTKEDWKSYGFAKGSWAYHGLGLPVSRPMWIDLPSPAKDLSHPIRPEHDPSKAPLRLGLFADFGNGLYPTKAIARQLARAKLPYVFHLGDVYYRGSAEEFGDYFEKPLASMIEHSEFFMLSGNHEMYSKGIHFQSYIKEKHQRFPQLQRQNGEMFRLTGHGLQIIGIDTMWNGWQGGLPRAWARLGDREKELLELWLKDAGPNTFTVLLTSDEPWDNGGRSMTKFHGDLEPYIQRGLIDMWFWGNVHYAALYKPWQAEGCTRPGVIGSCIGHGGYPFYTQRKDQLPNGVEFAWMEEKHRFWPKANVRPDLGNNGWCEMQVERGASQWNIKLIYRDWVGRDRAIAEISKPDGSGIRLNSTRDIST